MGGTVGASHYSVRVHLRHSVLERDVANERKQFHLFVENAGWVVLFRCQVEPAQLRVRKGADGFKATSPQTLVLRELLQHACGYASPVSKIRAKTFGSSSICFHRMSAPLSIRSNNSASGMQRARAAFAVE